MTSKIFLWSLVFLNEKCFNPPNYFQLNYFEITKDLFKFTALNSGLSSMRGGALDFSRKRKKEKKSDNFRMEDSRKSHDL